jgi:hypothetical protein
MESVIIEFFTIRSNPEIGNRISPIPRGETVAISSTPDRRYCIKRKNEKKGNIVKDVRGGLDF